MRMIFDKAFRELHVKLTSMQLVGELIAAISVHYDAFMKLENMHFCGKELSESANELL